MTSRDGSEFMLDAFCQNSSQPAISDASTTGLIRTNSGGTATRVATIPTNRKTLLNPPSPPTAALDRAGGVGCRPDSPAFRNPSNMQFSPLQSQNTQRRERGTELVSLSNFEQVPRIKGVFNCPVSLKACHIEGVNPTELLPRETKDFMGPDVPENIARSRQMACENRRKATLERVRRRYELILTEEQGNEAQASVNAKNEDVKGNHREKERQKQIDPALSSHTTAPRNSSLIGHVLRSSSLPCRTSPSRSCLTSIGRFTRDKSYGRSKSIGAMMIYSRLISSNREPTETEIRMLERIDEREFRTAAARRRVVLDDREREQKIIEKELKKSLQVVSHMMEKEAKRNKDANLRRQQWAERVKTIRERQRREELERQMKLEARLAQTNVS